MTCIGLVITILSLGASLLAAFFAYKSFIASKSPKLVLETVFNNSLYIRNIGTDSAKKIRETTEMFRDVPSELWNFSGPIDYMKVESRGTTTMINFYDDKRPQPSTSTLVHFEYENTDGDKFYSDIKIERGSPVQQIYFTSSQLTKWGKY